MNRVEEIRRQFTPKREYSEKHGLIMKRTINYQDVDFLFEEIDRLKGEVEYWKGMDSSAEEIVTLKARIAELEAKVDDFKSASMLEFSGDPADIEPHHVEEEITNLRARVAELEEKKLSSYVQWSEQKNGLHVVVAERDRLKAEVMTVTEDLDCLWEAVMDMELHEHTDKLVCLLQARIAELEKRLSIATTNAVIGTENSEYFSCVSNRYRTALEEALEVMNTEEIVMKGMFCLTEVKRIITAALKEEE